MFFEIFDCKCLIYFTKNLPKNINFGFWINVITSSVPQKLVINLLMFRKMFFPSLKKES
jgi:hypothetical protein